MKRILRITCGVIGVIGIIVIGIVVFSTVGEPLVRGYLLRRSILNALDDASIVRVVEHSSRWDSPDHDADAYQEVVYSAITLTDEQIKSFRKVMPSSLDYSGSVFKGCIFKAHHRVEIERSKGRPFILHICFDCGEIALNDEFKRIMPQGWRSGLSSFVSGLGLRPDGPFEKD